MTTPRIVTLAQLAVLPVGAVVSPVVVEEGRAQFDIQGVMQLRPKATVTGVVEGFLVTVDELPDVRVIEGRVKTSPSVHHYALPGFYPHRFVVWSDEPEELMP